MPFPVFFSTQSLGENSQGRGGGSAGGLFLAKKTMVPVASLSVCGTSSSVSVWENLLNQFLFLQVPLKLESLHLTFWQLSGRGARRRDFFREQQIFLQRFSGLLQCCFVNSAEQGLSSIILICLMFFFVYILSFLSDNIIHYYTYLL